MCGICGIINFNKTPVDTKLLVSMRDSLRHRGPDDFGTLLLGLGQIKTLYTKYINPIWFRNLDELEKHFSILMHYSVGLAHRRLAIIDLSEKAKQPMSDITGRYHIVYNGEVYNFKEIGLELEKNGYKFKSRSDTEIILYSYIHWGVGCLSRFNGMFAFAIWDSLEEKIFLARDRFGKKPLYYCRDSDGNLMFASELKTLLLNDKIPKKLSYTALNCYLTLGYILSPLTMYENIWKLEPGSYLLISNKGKNINKTRYWDFANLFREKVKDNEKEAAERILFLMGQAVKRRLIGDVDIGAFLSGGVDSSAIVALMKKYHNEGLHTFSVGFEEDSYNELHDANRTANWFGTIHHKRICRVDKELNLLYQAINVYDELFSDNSLIPLVELSRLASETVKVVLSGDGADEMFAGYITHKASMYQHYFRFLPNYLKKYTLEKINKYVPVSLKKISWEYRLKQFLYGSVNSEKYAHYLWRNIFTPAERIVILGDDNKELVYDTDPFIYFNKYYEEVKDLGIFDQHLYVDIKTWLADDILVKLDRATMGTGLEARCPYLDIDLVSYTASLPYRFKLRSFGYYPYKQKYILKKALKNVVPEFVLKKKKAGFNSPVGLWLNDKSMNEFKLFNRLVFNEKIKYAD